MTDKQIESTTRQATQIRDLRSTQKEAFNVSLFQDMASKIKTWGVSQRQFIKRTSIKVSLIFRKYFSKNICWGQKFGPR